MLCTLKLSCYLFVDEGHICHYCIIKQMIHKDKQNDEQIFSKKQSLLSNWNIFNENSMKTGLLTFFFPQILSNYKLLQQEKKKLHLLCDLLNIWTKEITDCFSQYNERKYLIIQNHNGDSWRTTSATVNCTSTYLNKMVESHVIKWKNNILGIYKDSKNIHGMKINFVFFFFVIFFFTFYCFPLFFLILFFLEIYIYTCPTSSKQQRLWWSLLERAWYRIRL